MPTSITVAPGFTKSRVIIPARPIAATRISARRQTPGRSCVFEWQRSRWRWRSSAAWRRACPTMSLRPTTTASGRRSESAALENLHHSRRRARHQPRPLRRKKTDIHRMKAVHIFGGIDRHQNLLRIHLRRQRKLHQDSVDIVAPVQLFDQRAAIRRRNGFRRGNLLAVDANFLAALTLPRT